MITFALFCMLVHAACKSFPTLTVEYLIDDVLVGRGQDARVTLLWISASIFLSGAIGGLTYYGLEYLFKALATHVMVAMRADLMAHLVRLPLRFFHEQRMAFLISRLTNDVQLTFNTINIFISEIVLLPIMVLTAFGVAMSASWRLALLMLPFMPLIVLPVLRRGRKIKKRARRGLASLEDTTQTMLQTIAGMRVVKAFRAEDAEYERFVEANRVYRDRSLKVVKTKAAGRGMMDFIYTAFLALFALAGSWLVLEQKWGLTTGKLMKFVMALGLIYRPLKRLAAAYNNFQETLAASARLFELLDVPIAEEESRGGRKINGLQREIRFENVSFAYEPSAGPVLQGISFHIARGETVALVGRSGSGKSTTADLLAGFYDPSSGRITVDGTDLREIDRASWLSCLAFVSQSPFIFNTTPLENILYGRRDATRDEVIAAAKAASIHEVIAGLAEEYDTVLGERGEALSGGERQRLTIARAVLKDADVLILDEATSSLDSESERLVQQAIDRLAENRTTLVIAHRLSTVRRADRIVVLENGRILEMGTHDELVKARGAYADLYALQLG